MNNLFSRRCFLLLFRLFTYPITVYGSNGTRHRIRPNTYHSRGAHTHMHYWRQQNKTLSPAHILPYTCWHLASRAYVTVLLFCSVFEGAKASIHRKHWMWRRVCERRREREREVRAYIIANARNETLYDTQNERNSIPLSMMIKWVKLSPSPYIHTHTHTQSTYVSFAFACQRFANGNIHERWTEKINIKLSVRGSNKSVQTFFRTE